MNYLIPEIVVGKYITNNYGKAVIIIQKNCLVHGLKFQVISTHVYKTNEVENQEDRVQKRTLCIFFCLFSFESKVCFYCDDKQKMPIVKSLKY